MSLPTGTIQIRIPRTIKKGQIISVKARIIHPMESGFRKDENGKAIPAHYINDVKVYYGGQLVTHFEWTYAISKDPLLAFYLQADKAAELKLAWTDNLGDHGEKAVAVTLQ